jgi:chromosome segregation ATPase
MTDGTPLEQHEARRQEGDSGQDPPVASDTTVPAAAADRLRLESALLEAQEETRERRLAAEVIRKELARARQDLDAERAGRQDDAERFRESLAHLRASADEAIADEQRARLDLTARLHDAEETISRLREELEASRASLAEAIAETDDLRAELQNARAECTAVVETVADARGAAADARADTERLLERLRTLGERLG